MSTRVFVSIVTYNSARHLERCLESLAQQTYRDYSVAVMDNASTDDTKSIIAAHRASFSSILLSERNLGFSAAHNQLIRSSAADYVLVLNPDVVLEPAFLERMVHSMDSDPNAGSASGKIYRQAAAAPGSSRILDSTGIYFTPSQRHFDRGADQPDKGQYDRPEYVFGASGCAAFYRRKMLEDVREGEEYFDESFFAYREDADLAWRAQWLGWRCLYVPDAIACHERRVLPRYRKMLPQTINMHSFKNRFLLRVKNMDPGTYAAFFIPITLRDLSALLYVLALERSSLAAIPAFMRAFPEAWARRRRILSRRRISPGEIRSWFSYRPVSKPAAKQVELTLTRKRA